MGVQHGGTSVQAGLETAVDLSHEVNDRMIILWQTSKDLS